MVLRTCPASRASSSSTSCCFRDRFSHGLSSSSGGTVPEVRTRTGRPSGRLKRTEKPWRPALFQTRTSSLFQPFLRRTFTFSWSGRQGPVLSGELWMRRPLSVTCTRSSLPASSSRSRSPSLWR